MIVILWFAIHSNKILICLLEAFTVHRFVHCLSNTMPTRKYIYTQYSTFTSTKLNGFLKICKSTGNIIHQPIHLQTRDRMGECVNSLQTNFNLCVHNVSNRYQLKPVQSLHNQYVSLKCSIFQFCLHRNIFVPFRFNMS